MHHATIHRDEDCSRRAILLTGDGAHREFAQPLAWLRQRSHVVEVSPISDACRRLDEGMFPDLIVVAQPRPGRFWQSQIEQLHWRVPLARLVALLGNWCEGETCSGQPWPGVIRLFWYEFIARMEVELAALEGAVGAWSLPRTATLAERVGWSRHDTAEPRGGLIVIGTGSAVVYEGLADACARAGFSTAWLPPERSCRIKVAAAGIWDDTGRGPRDWRDIEAFHRSLHPAPTIALVGFPRGNECQQILNAGATAVLPKPFLVRDLITCLAQTLDLARAVPTRVPAA